MSEQDEAIDVRPAGELRVRQAQTIGVSFPDRTVDLIVIPYDTPTLVPFKGRMVKEEIAPGSFAGIQRRANRVRVNRDHDNTRVVGRAATFRPDHPDGLFAQVRIARTELGDETLELADEGILDASAAFAPMPRSEKWLTRSHVRYERCWLGHIAMTPDPAYETANVLAVRHAEEIERKERTPTPNLDLVRSWLAQDRYARL